MFLAQEHERAWGRESYTGRPTLEEIFASPVIVFWADTNDKQEDKRHTITLHDNLAELESHFLRLLFALDLPKRRPAKLFANGKKVRITGVKISFESDPNE